MDRIFKARLLSSTNSERQLQSISAYFSLGFFLVLCSMSMEIHLLTFSDRNEGREKKEKEGIPVSRLLVALGKSVRVSGTRT